MLTRRAASLEDKLRATLKELESSKNLCNQLLQERDDSEIEVKLIVDKNTELKNQLAELHIQHMDILDQHQHLRQLVSNFQQCSDTHELALRRISELELELSKAHNTITQLESVKVSEQSANTCSLYNELVGSVSRLSCEEPIVTIDLTNDTLTKNILCSSHNKIKKYLKINRVIRKIKKSLKRQKVYMLNNHIRRKNLCLLKDLHNCEKELEICRTKYNSDTQRLQEDLYSKENILREIFSRYEASQQDLSERMQEACELADLVKYNAERYESLTNNISCNCSCLPSPEPPCVTPIPELPCVTPTPDRPCITPIPEPPRVTPPSEPQCGTPLHLVPQSVVNPDSVTSVGKSVTYVFSDKFGQGFGSIFNQCSQHYIINHCVPGARFSHLIRKIKSTKFIPNSTIILLYGDSLAVTKKDIKECVNLMLHLNEVNKSKFIICSLPYSYNLSKEQNRHIFDLNMLLYNRTCQHVNAILYFDINQFLSRFKLTEYSMYLPASCKRHIANLLAYNIHIDTGTCYVPKDTVSISTNISIDTPSSLNY